MTRKGENLVALADHGVRTPRGFMLGMEHYRSAVAYHLDAIEAALPDAEAVATVFGTIPMPASTRVALDVGLAGIGPVDRLAVRSSGSVVTRGGVVDEDSTATALAGQFESLLQVPVESVEDAVRQCWASLFNQRSIVSFGVDRSYVENSAMAVVIQEMVAASASAVMMTVNPLADGATGSVDLTVGPCEALVAGLISPDEATFARDTGDITSFEVGHKERRVVYADFSAGDNRTLVVNSEAVSSHPSVSPSTLRQIVDLGFQIESIFGAPQDVELVVTADGELVVTQARPVTCLPEAVTPFTNHNYITNEEN